MYIQQSVDQVLFLNRRLLLVHKDYFVVHSSGHSNLVSGRVRTLRSGIPPQPPQTYTLQCFSNVTISPTLVQRSKGGIKILINPYLVEESSSGWTERLRGCPYHPKRRKFTRKKPLHQKTVLWRIQLSIGSLDWCEGNKVHRSVSGHVFPSTTDKTSTPLIEGVRLSNLTSEG